MCILISTIPHKWVQLGFNCLFVVLHVSFSSSVWLFAIFFLLDWITLLLLLLLVHLKYSMLTLDVHCSKYRKIFPSIFSFSRSYVWFAYCCGIVLVVFLFLLAIEVIYFFTRYVQIQFPILLGYLLPLNGYFQICMWFFQID